VLDGAATVWSYDGPTGDLPIDPKALEPRRVLDALRAGVGLRVGFRLEWSTGRAASVLLVATDAPSCRWAEQLLVPAYGRGRWRRVRERSGARRFAAVCSFARSNGEPGSTLPHADPTPWSDVVLEALNGLPAGFTVTWAFRGLGLGPWKTPIGRSAEPERIPIGWRARPLTSPERIDRDRRELRRRAPIWEASVSISSEGALTTSRDVRSVEGVIEAASTRDGDARLRFVRPGRFFARRPPSLLLAEPEVAGILPGRTTRFAGTRREESTGTRRLEVGVDAGARPIFLAVEPAEGRHVAIVGETGMGKSSLLVRLAAAASSFGSVVLFDPIGDTGRRFLAALPTNVRSRVLWISPAESPVAADMLEPLRDASRDPIGSDRALGALVDALRRVRAARYADTPFWGPRIEETLRLTLAATAATPGATIAEAERILAASVGRATPIAPEARPALDALRERVRDRPEEIDGSRRLLREISSRPSLARLLGARHPRFRFRDLSAPARIFVLTGDAARVGEAASRYLLAIYLALFWTERLSLPDPAKTFLVLDESQWYAHDSLSEMLRLGRRANLHVWLATQGLASLPEGVRDAVRTNVADLVVFRGSPDEARELARMTPALAPEALWSLPRGAAAVLLGKGERVAFLEPGPPPRVTVPADDGAASVAAASRPYWVEEADESITPGRGGARDREESAAPERDRCREVLLVLWAALLESRGAAAVRVRLGELRRVVDPDGEAVRSVGRSLRAGGVLEEADRDANGPYWDVAREGFERLIGPGVDAVDLARAAERWRSIRGGGAEPAQ